MPESSFAESTTPSAEVARSAGTGWSRKAQTAMLLLNALPLFHLVVIASCAACVSGLLAKTVVVVGGIYLVPPLLVRLLFSLRPVTAGSYPLDGAEFLRWWTSAQAQILFCRFPFFEELLRMVPGLYSAWLRLWGARVGRLTYWAPGLCILDRSLLEIGDDVIFGAGVRLNPHVIAEDETGATRLHLGTVRIGAGCRVGGYSLLTAGTVVEAGQTLKAFSLSPPFTHWHEGRRARIAIPQ
jgi:hypothetical protein